MNTLMAIHVAGGAVSLMSGTVAFAASKGSLPHVLAGRTFAAAMVVVGITASILGPSATPVQSPVGGLMVCYFVATGWMAAHRHEGRPGAFERLACAAVLVMGALILFDGVQRVMAPPGMYASPPPPGAVIALGVLCLGAGLGDLRYLLRGTLSPTQRLSRHLWRMCFAFFIATGSFFLGQMDVLPPALRVMPLLLVLAFAPFGLMLFWLLRVRFGQGRSLSPPPKSAEQ